MAVRATIRIPMPVKMRAKQFMMFDAMKGLTEAIAEKEQQFYTKRELTGERMEEINQVLSTIRTGDVVTVTYDRHYGRRYRQLTGTVTKIDSFWQELQIGNMTISFSEIDTIAMAMLESQ